MSSNHNLKITPPLILFYSLKTNHKINKINKINRINIINKVKTNFNFNFNFNLIKVYYKAALIKHLTNQKKLRL